MIETIFALAVYGGEDLLFLVRASTFSPTCQASCSWIGGGVLEEDG